MQTADSLAVVETRLASLVDLLADDAASPPTADYVRTQLAAACIALRDARESIRRVAGVPT